MYFLCTNMRVLVLLFYAFMNYVISSAFLLCFFYPLQPLYATAVSLRKPEVSCEFITLILMNSNDYFDSSNQKVILYLFNHLWIWVIRFRYHFGGIWTYIEVCCWYNLQAYENFSSQIFIHQSTNRTGFGWICLGCFAVVNKSSWNKLDEANLFTCIYTSQCMVQLYSWIL